MNTLATEINPFMMMMNPESVLHTMEHSQQLRNLHSRQLRPLDKPLIPYASEAWMSRAAYDAMIDAEDAEDTDTMKEFTLH